MADSPSEAVNPENENPPAETSDVNQETPESSTEAPKGVETTLLSEVTAALKKGKAAPPAATDGTEKADPPGSTHSDPEGVGQDDLSEEEIKALRPKTQRNFQRLIERTHGLTDQVKERDAQIERLKTGAELSDRIAEYMETNGIQPEELDNVLAMTALIKTGRYEDALHILDPVHQELLKRTGNVLPADLKEQVKLGRITEPHARELAQARAKATNADNRERHTRESGARAAEKTTWQNQVAQGQRVASEWDQAKARSDPDWHLKQPLVGREIELELRRAGREGYPKTPAEVKALADKALKTVEAQLKGLAPKPKPQTAPTGDHASPRGKPQPKTALEAARLAIGG